MNKKKYEIGDWFYYNFNGANVKGGVLHRIEAIDRDDVRTNLHDKFCSYQFLINGGYDQYIRKAREYEIPDEFKKQEIVNNYDIY